MSPYEINIMLHYYCRCEDHEDIHRNPPVWQPTIKSFLELGLLESPLLSETRWEGMRYVITDRGRAYVNALQRVPLPMQVWVIPRTADAVDPVLTSSVEPSTRVKGI